MAHFRAAAKAFNDKGEHIGPGDWLKVIHTANRLAGEDVIFGEPESMGAWWAGGFVEEYPDARVLHRTDGSVSVLSKTPRGDDLIRRAAAEHGWHVAD
jgi:hypothetical protein